MKKIFSLLLIAFGTLLATETKLSETDLSKVSLQKPIQTNDTISIDPQINSGFQQDETRPRLPGIVPFVEILSQNVIVWAWDRYILQKDYAKISPSIWKRNLREGWTWDDNHWGINFFGHPYQGTFYFVAARSSGFNFYQSAFFTALGSWTWEYFGEREYPAFNDLVTTTIGGSLYGEMLFRLSQRMLAKPNPTWFEQAESFVLHPLSFLHWKAAGVRPHNPGFVPIELSIALGGGYRFGSDYRYNNNAANRLDNEWEEFFAFTGMHLVYGSPSKKVKQPAEYFTIDAHFEYGQEERMFNMNASAKLHNYNKKTSEKSWLDIGVYLDFDTFYGDLVTMGNLSLGLGLDIRAPISENIQLRYITKPGFIFLGSADFNYDELLQEIIPDYEVTRDYQYNYGAKYMTSLGLKIFERYTLQDRFDINVMKTMPNSEPHYGANGFDVIGVNQFVAEGQITKHLAIGLRLDSYFKIAAYTGEYFEPMSRTIHTVGAYTRAMF